MSWIALGWASQQRLARVTDKMVLIALADRHNEEMDASWPSVGWLTEFCCVDRKTVIASLDRLEGLGLIADTGRRTGKTRQVKIYSLAVNSPEKGIPKAEPLDGNSPVFSGKQSQKRNTEPSREPVTGASHHRASADGGKTIIPADWGLPAKADLPPKARACAEQWTDASYETHGEAFHGYWRSARRMYSDWNAVWANRVVALHGQVMRDQKFGNAAPDATVVPLHPNSGKAFARYQAGEISFEEFDRARRHTTGPPRSIGEIVNAAR